MPLSSDLISEFVEVTSANVDVKKEDSTVYGTIVVYDEEKYVRLDGSDILTPISSTTESGDGDRVMVLIKNHSATVTGNITNNSASAGRVDGIAGSLDIVANAVEANEGRFVTLEAGYANIEILDAKYAKVEQLEADNVTIHGTLNAHTAVIGELNNTYAKIADLNAATADITDLNATFANLETTVTENLSAQNAVIEELKSDYADIGNLDAKYANIDFANIGDAAVEKLHSELAFIKDGIFQDGEFTGELVAVTINADMITSGTLQVDRLLLRGENGLYYKLNVNPDGSIPDALKEVSQEELQNGLHGSHIIAKSITADHISVSDLVAFGATIGGYTITSKSIYSGVKESATNTTRGVYMDSEGQFAVGDANNYIKFYKNDDGVYKFDISADEIKLSSGSSLSSVDSTATKAYNKANTASNDAATANRTARDAVSAASTARSDVNDLKTRVSTAETSIQQNKEQIALAATKTEVEESLSGYYTKAQADAAINVKANEITTTVAETYASKDEHDKLGARVSETETAITQTSKELSAKLSADEYYGVRRFDGTFAQSDCYEGQGIQVVGEFGPIQNGSGDPYAVGMGKNICPDWELGSINSETGALQTNTASIRTSDYIRVTPGTIYTLSRTLTTNASYLQVRGYDASKQYLGYGPSVIEYVTGSDNGGTDSNPLSQTMTWGAILIKDGVRYLKFASPTNDLSDKYQFEIGSEPSEYKPNSNIRPITGRDTVSITRSGKNLFDIGVFEMSGSKRTEKSPPIKTVTITNNTITITGVPTQGYNYYKVYEAINCVGIAGRTVTLSATMSGTQPRIGIQCYKDDVRLSEKYFTATGSINVIIPETATHLTFIVYLNLDSYDNATTYTATYSNIQLELGSEATDYESYQGDVYDIDFGQPVYDAMVDIAKGEVTEKRVLVNMKDLSWRNSSNASAIGRFVAVTPNMLNSLPICDMLPCGAVFNTASHETWTLYANAGAKFVIQTDLTNLTEWTDWLERNDPKLCYELPEPSTITIPSQDIPAVEGFNTVWTDMEGGIIEFGHESLSGLGGASRHEMTTELNLKAGSAELKVTSDRLYEAESKITQMADSLSTLVKGKNGESLMTQTDSGWTFDISNITSTVETATTDIDKLKSDATSASTRLDAVDDALSDIGKKTEYVNIEVDENDRPSILLGEGDSDFKVKITNVDIQFMEGTTVPASISNQAMNIEKAVIKEELRQGGFAWVARSNGNYGLVWKGGID